jgi:DNA transformation protein
MSYSVSWADELLGLMEGVGKVTTKKMFGALAYYHGPILFACLMDDDVFYLKAKGAFAEELKAMGSKLFTYHGRSGKTVNMPYWTAPPACLDDADEMALWCKKALANLSSSPKSATKLPAKKSLGKKR